VEDSEILAVGLQGLHSELDDADAIVRAAERSGRLEAERLLQQGILQSRQLLARAEEEAMAPGIERARARELLSHAQGEAQQMSAQARAAAELVLLRARADAFEARSNAQGAVEARLIQLQAAHYGAAERRGFEETRRVPAAPQAPLRLPELDSPRPPADAQERKSAQELVGAQDLRGSTTRPAVEEVAEGEPDRELVSQRFAIQARYGFASLLALQQAAGCMPEVASAHVEVQKDGTALLVMVADPPVSLAELARVLPGVPLVPEGTTSGSAS
jgi:hypothetical protein